MWVMSVVCESLMSAKRAAISADFLTERASLQPPEVMVVDWTDLPAKGNCSLLNNRVG